MELQLDKDLQIPIHQERHHFYLKPDAFIQDMGDCHSISVLTYQDSPLKMIAPSYTSATMKKTSDGNADYWESYKGLCILLLVHKCRRVFLFVPRQWTLPSGNTLDDFTRTRRTVIQLPNGEQQELQDEWDTKQTNIQGLNDEQSQGFTELFLQNKREGFKPRRRMSEAEIKDEDIQQKIEEDMQQGLADRDMDFTPREYDSCTKIRHLWIRHHLQPKGSWCMAGTESRPIVSELQSYRLIRVVPLNRQPGYPPYQEQWEHADINNPSSHIQDLPYDWEEFSLY